MDDLICLDELVDLTELPEKIIYALIKTGGFPQKKMTLDGDPLWDENKVRQWLYEKQKLERGKLKEPVINRMKTL